MSTERRILAELTRVEDERARGAETITDAQVDVLGWHLHAAKEAGRQEILDRLQRMFDAALEQATAGEDNAVAGVEWLKNNFPELREDTPDAE